MLINRAEFFLKSFSESDDDRRGILLRLSSEHEESNLKIRKFSRIVLIQLTKFIKNKNVHPTAIYQALALFSAKVLPGMVFNFL